MCECLNVERPPKICVNVWMLNVHRQYVWMFECWTSTDNMFECLNVERPPTIWHAYSEREQVQQFKKMNSRVKMAGYKSVKWVTYDTAKMVSKRKFWIEVFQSVVLDGVNKSAVMHENNEAFLQIENLL